MATFIRISEAASLALHTAAYLACTPRRLVSSREIAEALGASENHLAKVLQRLAHAGFVDSTRGPRGGFRIRSGWERIRLIDIYEAIEGPFAPARCLLDVPACRGNCCPLGALVHDTNDSARAILGGTTLAEMAKSFKSRRKGRRAGATVRRAGSSKQEGTS